MSNHRHMIAFKSTNIVPSGRCLLSAKWEVGYEYYLGVDRSLKNLELNASSLPLPPPAFPGLPQPPPTSPPFPSLPPIFLLFNLSISTSLNTRTWDHTRTAWHMRCKGERKKERKKGVNGRMTKHSHSEQCGSGRNQAPRLHHRCSCRIWSRRSGRCGGGLR